jgi:hypothetical protein
MVQVGFARVTYLAPGYHPEVSLTPGVGRKSTRCIVAEDEVALGHSTSRSSGFYA